MQNINLLKIFSCWGGKEKFSSEKCKILFIEYRLTFLKYEKHDLIHAAHCKDATEELKARWLKCHLILKATDTILTLLC